MKLAAIVFLFATEMVRVVEVPDGRTLVVERRGEQAAIRLAGVELTDSRAARELLTWSASRSWVMIEPSSGGTYRVYRSPDALFLNRELVLRGCARATEDGIEPQQVVPMRYLGVVNPGLPAPPAKAKAKATKEPKPPNAKPPAPKRAPSRRRR